MTGRGPARRAIVLYDPGCRGCRGAMRLAARLDVRKRLAFLSLADQEAAELVAGVPPADLESSWQVLAHGERLQRGAAGIAVAAILLGARGRVPRPRALLGIADVLYGWVARTRSLWGRLFPDSPGPRRYP